MKILIVEDDLNMLQLLFQHLKRNGFQCEIANSFFDALQRINQFQYDSALIDLSLPDGDGLRLVRLLRKEDPQTAIIITSARVSIDDRVLGLDEGADDYLVKPFSLSELTARIRAVARRKMNLLSQELDFGKLKIRLDAREVTADGLELHLTRKEYDILLYLARNKNRVVTKDSIAEYLWGDFMDETFSFDFIYVHIKNLRKKLSEQGCGDFLKTVYGIGYKFVAT